MRATMSSADSKAFQKLIAVPSLPELGPGPRAGVLPLDELNARLDRFLSAVKLPAHTGALLRAAALLWHDHHEPAHALVQDDPCRESSFLHAILHRREPDAGNAKYWFHRVGPHPAFPVIAARVRVLPAGAALTLLQEKLTPSGAWDPFAFVDGCERARRRGGDDPQNIFLRQAQQTEFEVLLEYLFGPE